MSWYKKAKIIIALPEELDRASDYSDPVEQFDWIENYTSRRNWNKLGLDREQKLNAKRIRDMAYDLKIESNVDAIEKASEDMAKKVLPKSILIPIPSSSGSTGPNVALANAIAKKTGSRVVDILGRSAAVMPLHQRRKERGIRNIEKLPHNMILKTDERDVLLRHVSSGGRIYLIDNVITSGYTINAARKTLNLPNVVGLAYAKA